MKLVKSASTENKEEDKIELKKKINELIKEIDHCVALLNNQCMNSELININLIIADRPYPLKVKPEEEEMVKNAAKQINQKVNELKDVYAAKDKQDFLAMSALTYAVEAAHLKNKSSHFDLQSQQKITDIAKLLNDL
jgi:cell division protein ZapA